MPPELLREWVKEGLKEGGLRHSDIARGILAVAVIYFPVIHPLEM